MSKERVYAITREDGVNLSINVDKFKKSVENALRNWINYDGLYFIRQRVYRDGRWELEIRTSWYPNSPYYNHKHKLRWDTDEDVEDILGKVIAHFAKWYTVNGTR